VLTMGALASDPTPRVAKSFLVSYWSVPSESWIVEACLPFVTKLHLAGVRGLESVYLSDLRQFVSFEPTGMVAKLYVDAAAIMKADLKNLILAQAPDREKAIAAELDRLGELIKAPLSIDAL
jgi:hypothetical protein